jgi:hypothetical protein
MAYKVIGGEYNVFSAAPYKVIQDFVLDSASDLASLPDCAPGSTAIVAAKDGPIYMVNASGEWKEI